MKDVKFNLADNLKPQDRKALDEAKSKLKVMSDLASPLVMSQCFCDKIRSMVARCPDCSKQLVFEKRAN